MRKAMKIGAYLLLGTMTLCGLSSCHDDDPNYDNVTPPTVADVHNISGSIAGIDGKGISGATVTMSGTKTENTTTDANGYFVFSDVKVGTYNLKVTATGKLSKETTVSVTDTGNGKNVVWNVMLASEESVTNVTVIQTDGGEGSVTTEALAGNDKAEVPVQVTVPANATNKSTTITIAPIYSEDEAATRAATTRATENTMLAGAKISCSDASVQLTSPVELTFNVDDVTTANVKAQKYHNGAWVDVPCTVEDGKVVVSADEFTAYGLFCGINFGISSRNVGITFAQSEWNNLYGSGNMTVESATYNYTVGMDISVASSRNVFTALLIEALARQYGANSYTTQGSYPLNLTLPIGTALNISGTQQVNTVSASVGSWTVSGTQYGDVTITATTYNRNHTGSGN